MYNETNNKLPAKTYLLPRGEQDKYNLMSFFMFVNKPGLPLVHGYLSM